MEQRRTRLLQYVPARWHPFLTHLSMRELRIRAGAPLCVVTSERIEHLPVSVTKEEVEACFLRFCDRAVHSHQEELAQGFVTTADGFRVGIAGHAVVNNGQVVSYRDLTSLCVRVSCIIDGCAAPLLPFIEDHGILHGMLLCGVPGCGKTTLLRDAALSLATTHRISVVDERCEIAVEPMTSCDVLKGCPKATGILQAVRVLSPEAVIVDELGDDAEWQSVESSCYLGVPMVASAHIGSPSDALARPLLKRLLVNGGFEYLVFLPPPHRIGEAADVWKARDLLEDDRNPVGRVYLRGSRDRRSIAIEKHGDTVARMGGAVAATSRRVTLHRFAD